MVLKSYRLKLKRKTNKNKKRPARDLITGGVTALLGVALLAETASAIRRI